MRAQVLEHPRADGPPPLEAREREALPPGTGELLLEVDACAACRTDLQIVRGDVAARRLPLIPGHQVVGRVAGLGEGVSDWAMGDRAGAFWLASSCGTCQACRIGRENLCPEARFTGWDVDGGYAQAMLVRADYALRLPDGEPMALAPLLCGGVIGYRALKRSGIQPGGRLGLYGFGASASLAIQVARHWGCEVYVATRAPADRARALELGAVWAGDASERPPVALDAAVTFAPVGSVVIAALQALDRGGTVAINAIHLDGIPAFDYDDLWWERSITSVANVTRADAREFLALAAEIGIATNPHPYALDDASSALADLEAGVIGAGAAVLLP
ncbi:MAG: zinc-dependent alcohol dehydrogenase family protein [Chloroflexota bacterium]|nr:zinc-dependent alcohol dehydrogenase family protein [Chloroflexota bacterium]